MAAEQKAQTKPVGYYVGEVSIQTAEVVARPDGTALTDKQALAEILNKLDRLIAIMK